jgi:PPIC-type PPIASE domain
MLSFVSLLKTLRREPLAHFLLLGAALFLLFQWRGGGGPGSHRIVVTPGEIEHLGAGFSRTWQRPPTAAELKGLVDDYVREEIATREAATLGLDRDDTIIRRRLRQKLEFVVEDEAASTKPSDAQLQGWLDAHPEAFHVEPAVALRQVHLNSDRRGKATEADARLLLERLRRLGKDADISRFGDSIMLPAEIPLSSVRDIARDFGHDFAEAVVRLEPGEWQGPIESGYGLHLVLVRERQEGRRPALAEVRNAVEREYMAARRKQQLDAMYERLLARYTVVVEMPKAGPEGTQDASAGSR